MTERPHGDDPADRAARLYDQFAVQLYRYAVVILADRAAAADAVQAVFMAMMRAKATIEFDERYLRRAMRNECFTMLRRRQREHLLESAQSLLEPVAALDHPEERMAIERALRTLAAEQREV